MRRVDSAPPLTYKEMLSDNFGSFEPILNQNTFRRGSLRLLKDELVHGPAKDYPAERYRPVTGAQFYQGELVLPDDGAWNTEGRPLPDGLPLHPWIIDMLNNPDIGVVTGKGVFYEYGPNYTADACLVRYHADETAILLVQRADSGLWALPGGFVDSGEEAYSTALRETCEEAEVDLARHEFTAYPIYQGPVADIRMTAHAWPETSLFAIELLNDYGLPPINQSYEVDDTDTLTACWVALPDIPTNLFGSHAILIDAALQKLHLTPQ